MVYIRLGRKTEILRLWCLVVVNNFAVRAIVDGEVVTILRSHVVVRGRAIQAEDADQRRSKTLV